MLRKLGDVLHKQKLFRVAASKFTQAGDKESAIQSLIKSNSPDTVWYMICFCIYIIFCDVILLYFDVFYDVCEAAPDPHFWGGRS